MYALDFQLDRILSEGLDNRFQRHTEMADCVRSWAKKNFSLLADEKYASNTVTCINNTRNIDVSALNKALGERGAVISNGYGSLKDVTFRIAHMADTTLDEIKTLLLNIDQILNLE